MDLLFRFDLMYSNFEHDSGTGTVGKKKNSLRCDYLRTDEFTVVFACVGCGVSFTFENIILSLCLSFWTHCIYAGTARETTTIAQQAIQWHYTDNDSLLPVMYTGCWCACVPSTQQRKFIPSHIPLHLFALGFWLCAFHRLPLFVVYVSAEQWR